MTHKNRTCEPLVAALNRPEGGLSLTPELLNLIVVRLEEALSDPRDGHLVAFRDQLSALLRSGMRGLPSDLIAQLREAERAATPVGAGYILGNLAMAQALSARAMDRRCGENFDEQLSSDSLKPYVRALLEGAATNIGLVDRVGHAAETVSRKLKILRAIGAADFRRDGQHVYNFLTPAAVAIASTWAKTETSMPSPRRDRVINILTNEREIPEFMKTTQNFSGAESPALEFQH